MQNIINKSRNIYRVYSKKNFKYASIYKTPYQWKIFETSGV